MILITLLGVTHGAEELARTLREATDLRYRIEASFIVHHELVGIDRVRSGGELVSFDSQLEIGCRGRGLAGAHALDCRIALASVVSDSDSPEVSGLVQLATETLPGARVTVVYDKRPHAVFLDAEASDLARLVVERSLAGLDLTMSAPSADSWRENRTALLPPTSASGPSWRVDLEHEVKGRSEALVRIHTVGTVYLHDVGLDRALSRRIVGHIDGFAQVDPLRGVVVRREWTTRLSGGGFYQLGSVELTSKGDPLAGPE